MLKQNPFSLYDFMGYFIPGALANYILFTIKCISQNPFDIDSIVKCLPEINSSGILLFVIVSYILGHLLSFLSSYTIEKFANWKYTYPSRYLLKDINSLDKHHFFHKYGKKIEILGNIWRWLLIGLLLPVVAIDFALSNILGFKNILHNPLDPFLIHSIKKKTVQLFDKLGLDNTLYNSTPQADFHRIVSHYVYENSKNHPQKMINYVSLYGLLRTMTLIFNFIAYYVIGYKYLYKEFRFWHSVDWSKVFISLLLLLTCYIFFMGFMKFYKRYTLEGFMILVVTDLSDKKDDNKTDNIE